METTMLVIWIAALVFFVVIEAVTTQLLTIWFAAGALCALIARIAGAEIWVQCAVFTLVSLLALVLTRPLVKKFTSRKAQPTNADRIIGESGVVLEDIDNVSGKGLVKVCGATWSARSSDGTPIAKDVSVRIDAIEGVKVIVSQNNKED